MAMQHDDVFWMQQAYEQALIAKQCGEVPVGAVIVDAANTLLSAACNTMIHAQDACGHAEIVAIRKACLAVHNYRLSGATLYVTLEPCVMCAGAIVQSRLARVFFATRDFKAGAAGSVYNFLQGYPLNHAVQIDEGILQPTCAALLVDFFKDRRDRS